MLAVTTRNRLRSARFCLPMLRARGVIARQLADTPGLVRYASATASPTEFLTLTVWEDKQAMQAFMQSGAHERFMWLFSRWTESFWGMRWEPSKSELGTWHDLSLSRGATPTRPVSPLVTVGLLPPDPPRAGPTGPRPDSGTVEPRASGLFAATARLEGTASLGAAFWAGRRLRAEGASGSELVRWAVGLEWPPQGLLITIWRDNPTARRRALDLLEQLGASWAMCWQPGDYEIGHWDGLRLRLASRRQTKTAVGGRAGARPGQNQ
jgi:hypothetical protein